MAENKQQLITILSIDGGGIRGIIPATILALLEDLLQKIDGEEARIADYFDIIAGTSTGSLITSLLVAPEKGTGRPRPASAIVDFYKTDGPHIFSKKAESAYQATHKPDDEGSTTLSKREKMKQYMGINHAIKAVTKLREPKYTNEHLIKKVNELLGDMKISETYTKVVIPAFSTRTKDPLVFSHLLERDPGITLADAVISSSAAPYYFAPHSFSVKGQDYELIDGGIVANNPVILAIGKAKKKYPEHAESFGCYRILSLGTGKVHERNLRKLLCSGRGGVLDWFVNTKGGTPPLVEVMFRANAVATDMYTSTMLGNFNQFPYYLRIQEYDLDKKMDSMNNATTKNLADLQKVAENLMEKHVTVANACTGYQEELNGEGTPTNNGDALAKFARMLATEKKSAALR